MPTSDSRFALTLSTQHAGVVQPEGSLVVVGYMKLTSMCPQAQLVLLQKLRSCSTPNMQAWCSLLQPEGSLVVVGAHEANTRVPPGTAGAAAVVFQAYVTDALKAAAAEAHQVGARV